LITVVVVLGISKDALLRERDQAQIKQLSERLSGVESKNEHLSKIVTGEFRLFNMIKKKVDRDCEQMYNLIEIVRKQRGPKHYIPPH
jgi:hypothetical protein